MLVKYSLMNYVHKVDMTVEGQIWIELTCFPEYKFGGVYIPPEDSLYFEQVLFGLLSGNVQNHSKVVILGDFNSRVSIPDLLDVDGRQCEYRGVKDLVLNNNGKRLLDICRNDDLVVANHLRFEGKQFGGNMSYKQGMNWISELDLCLIKEKALPALQHLEINHDVQGSDHAPLSIVLEFNTLREISTDLILERAVNLGRSDAHLGVNGTLCKGPSCKLVNLECFESVMNRNFPLKLIVRKP